MIENMNRIKATIENETLPEVAFYPSPHSPNSPISLHPIIPVVSTANLSSTWETGQLYFESEMFGQYVSRIFYEINKQARRDI